MDFKKRLKELRKKKNVTQKEVGFILGYNCSAISNYECGKNEPSIRDIILLAKYFNVSVDYLIGATDTIFNQKTTTETILQLFSIIYNNFPEDIQKYMRFLIKKIFLQYCYKKNKYQKIPSFIKEGIFLKLLKISLSIFLSFMYLII